MTVANFKQLIDNQAISEFTINVNYDKFDHAKRYSKEDIIRAIISIDTDANQTPVQVSNSDELTQLLKLALQTDQIVKPKLVTNINNISTSFDIERYRNSKVPQIRTLMSKYFDRQIESFDNADDKDNVIHNYRVLKNCIDAVYQLQYCVADKNSNLQSKHMRLKLTHFGLFLQFMHHFWLDGVTRIFGYGLASVTLTYPLALLMSKLDDTLGTRSNTVYELPLPIHDPNDSFFGKTMRYQPGLFNAIPSFLAYILGTLGSFVATAIIYPMMMLMSIVLYPIFYMSLHIKELLSPKYNYDLEKISSASLHSPLKSQCIKTVNQSLAPGAMLTFEDLVDDLDNIRVHNLTFQLKQTDYLLQDAKTLSQLLRHHLVISTDIGNYTIVDKQQLLNLLCKIEDNQNERMRTHQSRLSIASSMAIDAGRVLNKGRRDDADFKKILKKVCNQLGKATYYLNKLSNLSEKDYHKNVDALAGIQDENNVARAALLGIALPFERTFNSDKAIMPDNSSQHPDNTVSAEPTQPPPMLNELPFEIRKLITNFFLQQQCNVSEDRATVLLNRAESDYDDNLFKETGHYHEMR